MTHTDGIFTDWLGPVTFSPPTFFEQLTAALFLFIGLAGLFLMIAGIARIAVAFWDWREQRRAVRYLRRVMYRRAFPPPGREGRAERIYPG
jgi:hypothetical protein